MQHQRSDDVAVHPLDLMGSIKDEWRVSKQSIHSGDLIVSHVVLPPDEIAHPPLTHHCLVLQTQHNVHSIIRIDDQEYNGVRSIGNFCLKPSPCQAFYAWETTVEAILLLLTPAFLQRTAAQTECLNPDALELRPVLVGQDPQLEQLAQAFYREMKTEGLGGRLYRESLTHCFAIHLLRHYCTTPAKLRTDERGLSQKRLRLALEVIHASLDQSLRLETVAAELGINVYYFNRLFRQSMGISPYQYVLRQRLEKAKRLLQNSELSIAEITLECGFANPSHLARHFRKSVGMSPKLYRQRGYL
ncbi:MAG: AraC family transcriptional regulator [Cyanobacteria bacterium J06635_15]